MKDKQARKDIQTLRNNLDDEINSRIMHDTDMINKIKDLKNEIEMLHGHLRIRYGGNILKYECPDYTESDFTILKTHFQMLCKHFDIEFDYKKPGWVLSKKKKAQGALIDNLTLDELDLVNDWASKPTPFDKEILKNASEQLQKFSIDMNAEKMRDKFYKDFGKQLFENYVKLSEKHQNTLKVKILDPVYGNFDISIKKEKKK